MNTIFDISSPNKDLQQSIFQELAKADVLNADPMTSLNINESLNRFAVYGDIQSQLTTSMYYAASSTNPILVSNGLFSDPYILVDSWGLADALTAFTELKRRMVHNYRIAYLHFRSDTNSDQGRRGSLASFRQLVRPPQETWYTFDGYDLDLTIKTIIDHMSRIDRV